MPLAKSNLRAPKLIFNYSHEKNIQLLKERKIGFEEIIQAIRDGNLLSIRKHHNPKKYPTQKLMFVRILDEVYVVPFVVEETGALFLKTAFPNKKARKEFLNV